MKFSKEHPFLTAYIGFIAYFAMLSVGVAWANSTIVFLLSNVSFPLAEMWNCGGIALMPIGGFYIFRYIVKKHILTPSEQSEETKK